MSPPLISEYKKFFAVKRIIQTFLGGPKLSSHPILIVVQITLFTLPAVLLSVVDLAETTKNLKWRALIVGVSMLLMEIFFNFLFFLLKRGSRNVVPSKGLHNLLEEEDQNEFEGFLKASTWSFVAPNSTLGYLQFFAISIIAACFAACTPLVFSWVTSGFLRGLAVFSLCIARYSAVIHLTPEVATFDPIRKVALRFYRPFYILLVGLSYAVTSQICEDGVGDFYFVFALACLPFLWLPGVLPPVDSVLPWILETTFRCFGGVPSYYYFGTLLGILVGGVCSILAFVAATQNPVLQQVLECVFSYLITSDIGAILNARSLLCEDVPAVTALRRLFRPGLVILSSIFCVILAIVSEISKHYYEGLASSTLTISLSSWLIRHLLMSRKSAPPKPIVLFHTIWDGILTFILHTWITIEVNSEVKQARGSAQGLIDLSHHMLTIRAFSAAIYSPKMMTLDMVVSSLYLRQAWESWPHFSFVVVLFFVSVIRQRIIRLFRLLRTMIIFVHALFASSLLSSKWKFALASVASMPLSIVSLVVVTLVDGSTLVPLFTLPIFLVGYPRPVSFWKDKWIPDSGSAKRITGSDVEGKSLDWTIYAQLAPVLTRTFVRKVYKARMILEEGQCFFGRYEDRLIFLRVLASGWNFVYINVKGLEMQEQTSCHHQEAAKIDELFEKSFGTSRRVFATGIRAAIFSAFSSELRLTVPTYAESKSNIANLSSKEELQVFQCLFYRAFSYLWIKKNPAFKGESYQRPIASGYHFLPPGGASVVNISPEALFDDKESDEDDTIFSHKSHNQDFSISNALASLTLFNMNTMPGSALNGSSSVAPFERPKRDAWSGNGSSFPFLQGMEPSGTQHERTRRNGMSRMSYNTDRSASFESASDELRPSEGPLSGLWVRKCVGESIPSNAVKVRVERLCAKVWKTIMGRDEDIYEVDLSHFFTDDFWKKARQVTTLSSRGKISMEEITVKAMRYAAKLALDEIYSGGIDADDSFIYGASDLKEEEIFYQLSLFEKSYKFSSAKHIPTHIDDRQKHIVSMSKTDDGRTQMKLLNFDALGVEFRVGSLSQFCVEGIWGNLNLELLYLTSDDDERFSIQHDPYLLRNICTQCANSPLGYAVYDGTFKVNLYDNTISSVQ